MHAIGNTQTYRIITSGHYCASLFWTTSSLQNSVRSIILSLCETFWNANHVTFIREESMPDEVREAC